MSLNLAPGSVLGRYRISGTLGRGGMGVVYAAVREDLDRKVAVKVLAPELTGDPAFRRRFAREAQTLSEVYSPHIIDIYEHGEQDGCLFIATPLVNGGDLRGLLTEHGGLPPLEALDLVQQVASALADAHAAGVIHRDIKPSNVLLHRSPDGERFAYLADFGIARSLDDEATLTGRLSGTRGYLAPECHAGARSTVASDVYAVGCLLVATLTGAPPYDGTDVQVAMQHLRGPVPHYPEPGVVAGAVNAILQRAMAKDPRERYDSAAELRADLRRAWALAQSHPGEVLDADSLTSDPEPTAPGLAPLPPYRSSGTQRRRPGARPQARRPRGARAVWTATLVAAAVVAAVLVPWEGFVDLRAEPGLDCVAADSAGTVTRLGTAGGAVRGAGRSGGATGADCQQASSSTPTPRGKHTCWDGTPVQHRVDCLEPMGLRGLLWVFPSLRRDLGRCEQLVDPTVDPSLRQWRCTVPLGSDDPVGAVTYSEWREPRDAWEYFDGRFARPAVNFRVGDKAAGYRWWSETRDEAGRLAMAVAYLQIGFSATMVSRTSEGLDRVCSTVRARSPRTFYGEPIVCTRQTPRPPQVPGWSQNAV
ncbi:serine/threonine protein kinase [Nocardioides sp. HDW12B]|uniref:serine/threonine-protein kinase n=1 Tax=Nocardioides sp. HDW12B TaxID=2714939 RepID=UPI00140742DF|nr:serine/threonine-protein kinase [Nocardioides sp. HDW12B]QIK64982.1 serine/threonine protein kinase [Nocardioides sp. HDW12B]